MEIDPVELHNSRAGSEGDPAGKLRKHQEDMTVRMCDALSKKGVVFAAQAPPAFGKTVVIRAVALALKEGGKRVLITEPTYSRLDQLTKYLEAIGLHPTVLLTRGRLIEQGLTCPMIQEKPAYFWCRAQNDLEEEGKGCAGFVCPVKLQSKQLSGSSLAIAVASAVVHHDEWLDEFDVGIFDESHTLPAILEQARVRRVGLEDIRVLQQHFSDSIPLQKAGKFMSKLETQVAPRPVGRNIIDNVFAGSIHDCVDILRSRIIQEARAKALPLGVQNAFHALEGFGRAVERSGFYSFTASRGTFYATPPFKSIGFRPPGRKREIQSSVALVSATIENPKLHVNDSGFGKLSLVAPYVYPHDPTITLSERRIFSLVDGPSLRVSGDESDIQARLVANDIIVGVLGKFQFPTLILCRSDRDRKSIQESIAKDIILSGRLLALDESEFEDVDSLERYVQTRMMKGRNLVVATASSKLWEGANLTINMLVIDSLPYVAPDPWAVQKGSWLNSKPFRTMIRRLQQGVGRLIREQGQWGVAVVVDGRFHSQWKMVRALLPDYVRDDVQFTHRERLLQDIEAFREEGTVRLANGRARAGLIRQSRLEETPSPVGGSEREV